MFADQIIDLFRNAIFLAMQMVAVIIIPSLCVGLVVSIFQAATQINEQTLSFLPRLIVTMAVLSFVGPWLAGSIYDFSMKIFFEIPYLIE